MALQHRSTPMVGRSHGIHAEPITFGFKAAGWFAEVGRDAGAPAAGAGADRGRQDLRRGRHACQLSAPRSSGFVCEALGLTPDPAATQVVSRDRHAELLTDAGHPGRDAGANRASRSGTSSARRWARRSSRSAPASRGAARCRTSATRCWPSGSAAWRDCCAADALVGLENMALWHERDISHSSAERFVFERALGVAAYATRSMADRAGRAGGGCRADARQPRPVSAGWSTPRRCCWRWWPRAPTARRRIGWCRAPPRCAGRRRDLPRRAAGRWRGAGAG